MMAWFLIHFFGGGLILFVLIVIYIYNDGKLINYAKMIDNYEDFFQRKISIPAYISTIDVTSPKIPLTEKEKILKMYRRVRILYFLRSFYAVLFLISLAAHSTWLNGNK